MNPAEARVQRYLLHLGMDPVRYEPDGNHPPDFATGDGTAVEVRRLNQHIDRTGNHVALERDAYPILNGMLRLLASFGSSKVGHSWWVHYQFRRPITQWKKLEPDVRSVLSQIDAAGVAPTDPIRVQHQFKLRVVPCSPADQRLVVLVGYIDHNAGGWVLHELQRNIQICIDEKTRKIASFRSRYARWWLVFVDYTGLGAHTLELNSFQEHVRVQHDWDRVALLNPRDHRHALIIDAATPTVEMPG